MERDIHKIDAKDKPLGRLAVEIAILLRGKQKPTYVPYKDDGGFVVVENADKVKVTGNKFKDKLYRWHTGWPGGLRQLTMREVVEKKGFGEVIKIAVLGMMPKNKLRPKQIKRLTFK